MTVAPELIITADPADGASQIGWSQIC